MNRWAVQITRAPSGHRCGESHPRAKLTDEIVRQMRKTYQEWVTTGQAGALGARRVTARLPTFSGARFGRRATLSRGSG